MAMKKAIFFTLDSLLASGIVIIAVLLVANLYSAEKTNANINYASQDLVRLFSTMTVGEINNDYVKSLIASGDITNLNNTINEQIGEFWASGNPLAYNFTKNLTESIVPSRYGFGIFVSDEEIYSRSLPVKSSLASSRHIISGINKAKPTESFSSKVILSSINSKTILAYAYFGGYIGDGPITQYLILPDSYSNINQAYMEFALSSDFNLQINDIPSGTFTNKEDDTIKADKYVINSSYYGNFKPGLNKIKMIFLNQSQFLGGGFIRVSLCSRDVNYLPFKYDAANNNVTKTEYLPGVEGVINIYSSFFVPGDLKSAKLFLNYSTNYQLFVNFGNVTVYNSNSTGDLAVTILNSNISKSFNSSYSLLSKKNVPLKIGHFDTHKFGNFDRKIDVFIDTPVDTSMDTQDVPDSPGQSRLDVAKYVEKNFVDLVLNKSLENRLGLVPYHASEEPGQSLDLTNNNVTLKNKIDGYATKSGNVCFSCAIRSSKDKLVANGNLSKKWYIILMGDGIANKCDTPPSACGTAAAKAEAIKYACNYSITYNITFYTIAFGVSADNTTLKNISEDCSNGKFFYSDNKSQLIIDFNQIGEDILSLTFTLQKTVASGVNSTLYPNSYLELQYVPEVSPFVFGKIPITLETDPFGNNITTGNISIPANVNVTEALVTSYSSDRWTERATINGNTFFNLSSYNISYVELGDPFVVNIPAKLVQYGNNIVDIKTSLGNPNQNLSGGSPDDKAIYNILVQNSVSFSGVAGKAVGCTWNLTFADGTSSMIKIPSSYAGNATCNFASGSFDADDSINIVAYQLFNNLDLNKDGKLDISLNSNNLEINTLTISKVPSLWGPIQVEIRVWE